MSNSTDKWSNMSVLKRKWVLINIFDFGVVVSILVSKNISIIVNITGDRHICSLVPD